MAYDPDIEDEEEEDDAEVDMRRCAVQQQELLASGLLFGTIGIW